MSLPTTFDPLLLRIDEILTQGLGNGTRIIPANYLDSRYLFPGKDLDSISRDVLPGPQVQAWISRLENPFTLSELSNTKEYHVYVEVEVAYDVPSELDKDTRRRITSLLASDTHTIVRALSNPGNLTQDSLGNETGLSDGFLQFLYSDEPSWSLNERSLVILQTHWKGWIFLSNNA